MYLYTIDFQYFYRNVLFDWRYNSLAEASVFDTVAGGILRCPTTSVHVLFFVLHYLNSFEATQTLILFCRMTKIISSLRLRK